MRRLGNGPASLGAAVITLSALAAVLAGCWWSSRRRHDEISSRAIATAAVLLGAGLVTAGRMPVGSFGGPTSHTFRWLWPLAAFTSFAVATAIGRNAPWRLPSRPVAVALLLATAVPALVNLVPSDQGAAVDEVGIPVIRDLGRQMQALEGRGPLLVDLREATFGDPYATAVLAQLQRRSIPFVTDDRGLLYQLGFSRRFTGRNARARLVLREGPSASTPPPGGRRIALHLGLTKFERRQLATLEARIASSVGAHGLRLNERGRAAVAKREAAPLPTPPPGEPFDARPLLASRLLVDLAQRDLLALDQTRQPLFDRYAQLQSRSDRQTVALYLAPVNAPPSPARPASP